MRPYADTSFLISLYILQVHSAAANAYMRQAGMGLTVTEFSLTEAVNGLNLAVFRKEIDVAARDHACTDGVE